MLIIRMLNVIFFSNITQDKDRKQKLLEHTVVAPKKNVCLDIYTDKLVTVMINAIDFDWLKFPQLKQSKKFVILT